MTSFLQNDEEIALIAKQLIPYADPRLHIHCEDS